MFAAFNAITNVLGQLAAGFTESSAADSHSDSHSHTGSHSLDGNDQSDRLYQPSVADVLRVRLLLNRMSIGKEGQEIYLPLEMINIILDFAEYWPHFSREDIFDVRRAIARGGNPNLENEFVLRTRPLGFPDDKLSPTQTPTPIPVSKEFDTDVFQNHIGRDDALAHPCRKIVFTIVSHDQGWSQYPRAGPTYENSWTWFEVGLERFNDSGKTDPTYDMEDLHTVRPAVSEVGDDSNRRFAFVHPLNSDEDVLVQRNICAYGEPREHRVVWSYLDDDDPESPEVQQRLRHGGRGTATGDGKFVRELKLGDVVTMWAKARFPQWTNVVERVKIEVYWAV